MPPDIPQEEKSVPPSAADADGEYDYQALRKKILTTWGKQEEGKELDLPDEMEKPVYHEKPLPKPPLSATIKKKVTEAQDLSMQERTRLEQMQAYVREKPVPVKEKCEHREGTLPAEEKSVPSAREWTEKDAENGCAMMRSSDLLDRGRHGSRSEGDEFAFCPLFRYN